MKEQRAHQPRLGIDIGRVIIDGSSHPNGGDTAFFQGDEETMLATPEMPKAVETIARLNQLFEGQIWLVSKCGSRVEQRTRRWLSAHRFFQWTGIDQTHLRFCKERKQKRQICQQLKLNHFIDDHPEVHAALLGFVEFQYFFGPQKGQVPRYGIHTPDRETVEQQVNRNLTS